MTNAYFVAPQIVPPASVKLRDLRKPILTLPSFMTPHWFSENMFFSKAARWILPLYSADIEALSGAPFDKFVYADIADKPEILRSFFAYPLFARTLSAFASMSDPEQQPSLFDLVHPLKMRFLDAWNAHADHVVGEPTASSLALAALQHGSDAEVAAITEFITYSALVIPFPDTAKIASEFRHSHSDASSFIEDVTTIIGTTSHLIPRDGAADGYFHAYFRLVQHGPEAPSLRSATLGDVSWSMYFHIDTWFHPHVRDEVIRALANPISGDSGYASTEPSDRAGWRGRYVGDGLKYPMFLPSLVTRLNLLYPEVGSSWTQVLSPVYERCVDAVAKHSSVGGADLTFLEMAEAYRLAVGEDKAAIYEWIVIVGLMEPTEAVVEFLQTEVHPIHGTKIADGPYRFAKRRLECMELPYRGPRFNHKPTDRAVVAELPKRSLN